MKRLIPPLFAFAVGFAAGWVLHQPRPRPADPAASDTLTVVRPAPPGFTETHLRVLSAADVDRNAPTVWHRRSDGPGATWVITAGYPGRRAVWTAREEQ
jgi:hypothetical protein